MAAAPLTLCSRASYLHTTGQKFVESCVGLTVVLCTVRSFFLASNQNLCIELLIHRI